MKKKFILAGIGLAFTFLAIVLSIFLYAKTDHAKNLLVNKINIAIPGTLLAENIEFSLINSYVKLDGIQIKDRQNITCLKFKSLLIDLKISSIFRKVLEITSFTVNSPEISLVMDINGRINLIDTLITKDEKFPEKEATKKENKGIPFNVVVKKAQVIEGAFYFNDPDNSIELRSLNVDINDANLFEQHLSLTSWLKNSRIKLKDKEILIENFSFLSELEQGSKIDFEAELESDLCDFKAKGIAYNIVKAPEIDFNITATSQLEKLNRFLENTINLGGFAKITLAGKGPVNNPEVAFNLDVANLKIDEDLKGDGLNLSASLVDRNLSIKKGTLNILGSNITFNGMVDLKDFFPKGFLNPAQNIDDLKYDFSFDQKNGDFQDLEKWVKGFSGRFSSFGKLTGKGIQPENLAANYHFNVVLEDFKQDKPETDFLDFETDISGTIEKGICKITRLNAKTGDTAIEASGQYDIFKKDLTAALNINAQDLYAITQPLGILPVKGSVDSNIRIAGHINNPEIKAMVSGKNLMSQDIFVSDLKFAGSINPLGLVDIQQLVVKDQDMILDVKGSAKVFEKQFKLKDVIKANILLSGQNINPKRFLEHADIKINQEQLDSLINSNININANLNMVVDYTIASSMDKINFYDIEIPVKNIKADLDLEKSEIAIVLEKIASLNASLNTENNQYQARINFNHSDLAPLFKSAGINGIKANIDGQINATGNIPVDLSEDIVKGLHAAQGNISLNADINGSFKEPDFNVLVDLSNLNYNLKRSGINISNLNGSITATPDIININALKTDVNEGHFSLTGNIGLKNYKIQDCKLAVFADSLDIPIPSKTGTKESILMEKFNSDLDINLQYDEIASQSAENLLEKEIPIKHIRADVNLNNLDLSALLDKTTDLKASFDPENSAYDLKLKFNKAVLDPIFKMVGLHEIKGSINGQVTSKGKVNIALPRDVMDGLKQTTGELSCIVNIKGSLEKPDFDADITLSGLGYPIPQAGISISNLNGKIKILNDVIQIQNITADLDKGSLSLDGKINLKDYTPVKGDIQFKGNNITLELPDMALIESSLDLTFSGTREKADLSGTFRMIKGKYYKDFTFDLADALSEKKRKTSPQEDKTNANATWLENISLNIDVDYKDPFAVDNNIAFILLEPDVNISGTALNPIVTGRVRVIEGTIIYLKKEFEIEKGIIDFVDPYKIDPYIDLSAKTKVRKWTITLEISGKTDNLKFNLFSKPEETHKDILSLLIAGKTTEEMGKSTKGSYTNILTDKAADIIGKSVEESTPLDSFKVGYSDSEGSNVSVTVGKKLSKRLEVLYSMKTEDEETVHTRAAEYKILENILLKAFNDSKGMFGTELTFKLEFR